MLTFVACSGATTADVTADQLSALSTSTAMVTISVGGDDAGFAEVLTECANRDGQVAYADLVDDQL